MSLPRLLSSFLANSLVVLKTEAIAATFTFASFDGLSTAFVDFLYRNLKIMRKVINYQAQNGCF